MNNSYDINLIKEAVKGSKSAIVELLKREQKNIYAMILFLKKDEEDILDITQNILLKISNKITKLKNPSAYKTWLNQIIINSYYDYLRKNKKKIYPLSIYDDESQDFTQIPDDTNNPQENLLNYELDYIIKKSISNLPTHYKIPITLREIQGLSYNEISNLTKTTVGTVKSRIARARTMVQNEIKKYTTN